MTTSKQFFGIWLVAILFAALIADNVQAQDITSKQKRQLKTIAATIDKAERWLDSDKLKSCAEKVNLAQQQIHFMAPTAKAPLMKLLQPEFERLSKIHKQLTDEKIEVEPLLPLPEPMADDASTISFARQIAPILVRNCGQCHVNQARGEFSAKDYGSLMNSLHVSAGRPDRSRLIEVIEDGAMPPNGEVDKKDLKTLKNWVRQGAMYDGENPAANLNQLAGQTQPATNRVRLRPTSPTGSETVSFGKDVAPILIESCSGCHIETRRIRGNFNMNNFARLLRGGDSGNPFVPGTPEESTLIKRLRGIDSEVMPPRKKLSEKKIKIIETWIAEGGSFDGLTAGMAIGNVAARANAEAQTHEQLAKARDELGMKNWKLIMSNDEPGTFNDEHFRVFGANRSGRLEEAASMANDLRDQIVTELKSDKKRPFVKGKPTIYLFERRYDLNELGKMLARKELPKDQTGRWDFSEVDAYVSVLISRGRTQESIKAEFAQQLAAIHVAGMSNDVPRWFADGVGYLTAARILRKSKNDTSKSWKASASRVVDNMDQPSSFAIGQLSERDAGLAGYAFVSDMKQKGNLTPMLRQLKNGYSFEAAFESQYGVKPNDFFRPQRNGRQGR